MIMHNLPVRVIPWLNIIESLGAIHFSLSLASPFQWTINNSVSCILLLSLSPFLIFLCVEFNFRRHGGSICFPAVIDWCWREGRHTHWHKRTFWLSRFQYNLWIRSLLAPRAVVSILY